MRKIKTKNNINKNNVNKDIIKLFYRNQLPNNLKLDEKNHKKSNTSIHIN